MGESENWRLEATVTPQPAVPNRIGQYELIEPVGAGGMGVVWKGLHVHLGQTVAIKFLAPNALADPQALSRFYGEMKAVGRVSHPHIVRALDAGQYDGHHILVMEFVDGICVRRLLNKKNPIPIAVACEIVRQAALGLSAIHAAGMIHRDIKPSNLFLCSDGMVKVLDLGLARPAIDRSEGELTLTGNVLGTVDYMPPEQAQNSRSVDARADLYSLGCTLYALLAGAPPFDGPSQSLESRLRAHRESTPRDLRDVRTDVPNEVSDLVIKLLAKRREDRVQTADELIENLSTFTANTDLRSWKQEFEKTLEPAQPSHTSLSSRAFASASVDTSIPSASTRLQTGSVGPPDPASVKPKPQSRWVLRFIYLAIAVTLVPLAVWSVFLISREKIPSTPPDSFHRAGLRVFTEESAQKWCPLLDRPPVEVFWPSSNALASHTWDPDQQQLRVTNDRFGLLGFGITDSLDFSLQIGIHQNRWEGGTGVYLGLRGWSPETPDVSWTGLWFQISQFQRSKATFYRIDLMSIELKIDPSGRRELLTNTLASEKIEKPAGEATFEIVTNAGKVTRIRFDGKLLNDLKRAVDKQPNPIDWTGAFGVLVQSADSTFRNCQFMKTTPES